MSDYVHCSRCSGYGRLNANEAIPEDKKRICPECRGVGRCAVISPKNLDRICQQLALAERRLKIAEAALKLLESEGGAATHAVAKQALREMEAVK